MEALRLGLAEGTSGGQSARTPIDRGGLGLVQLGEPVCGGVGAREGGGIRIRRWGFGNRESAPLTHPSVAQWAPVAPRCVGLCALLMADFGRPGGPLRTDEELFALY